MRSPLLATGLLLTPVLFLSAACAEGGPSGNADTRRAFDAGAWVAADADLPTDDPSEDPPTAEPPPPGPPPPGPTSSTCPGECVPATTEQSTEACGACGEGTHLRRRVCADDCTWGAWESSGGCDTAAACAPGETDVDTRSCSSSCGGTQTRTRPCEAASCRWGAWSAWSACDASCCGDGTCGSGESCSTCADCRAGHLGTGENGDACPASAAEQWRCVTIPTFGTRGSQVCRGGQWVTFHLNPRACSSCVCGYSTSCCAASGC